MATDQQPSSPTPSNEAPLADNITDVSVGSSNAPALVLVAIFAAAIALFVWWTRGGSPTPIPEETPTELVAIEATALEGPGDKLPILADGEPPDTPNSELDVAPSIMCRLLIDEQGNVVQARVYKPRLEYGPFEEAALAAVKDYKFEPALRKGKPIPVWVQWQVTFYNDVAEPEHTIQIKGSDTIGGALGPALGLAYSAINPSVKIDIEALGSSTAFVGLLDGSADIGAASRRARPKELEEAAAMGVDLKAWAIGYDGIAIIVHPDNPIQYLTIEQIGQIYRGEIDNWKQVGGLDRPIRRLSRPIYSGTQALFKSKVIRYGAGQEKAGFSRATEFVESSETISMEVAKDRNAIAYLGLGWIGPRVRVLGIQAKHDTQPIKATDKDAIRSRTYALVRPLFLYTRGIPQETIADFLRFTVSPAGRQLVEENGFIAPQTAIAIPSRPDDDADEDTPDIERVFFPFNATELETLDETRLLAWGQTIAQAPERRVFVEGHVDIGGPTPEDIELALQRAHTVADLLERSGIAGERMEVSAYGGEKPLSTNNTPAGRAANRRVDIFAAHVVELDNSASDGIEDIQ